MTTRTWPYPDLRNGTTIHHITDTHFQDDRAWLTGWFDRSRVDIEAMRVATTGGHVHTGDMINSYYGTAGPEGSQAVITAETGMYTSWRDGIGDGLPWAQAVGNHDMLGVLQPDGTRAGVSSQQWAESVGLDSPNNAHGWGELRVITIAPDHWIAVDGSQRENNDFRLSSATLDWLDSELSADSRPTFIAAHVPLLAQYPTDAYTADAANPRLHDVIGAHSNVAGWLCGHRHNGIDQAAAFETITVAGREIFAVCGEGGGGGWDQAGTAYSKEQWGSHMLSSWLTLLDEDTLDVRWRDHLSRSWVRRSDGVAHLLLTRSNN